jgi:hypothetical protein
MGTTWINRGHFYVPHVTPVLADLNFIVDSANGNGLGIRSLKGQAVQNVFMHTTQTPGKGPNGKLNPNPAAGYILIQLADNYTRAYGGFTSIIPPLSGTPLTSTTAGLAYVIVSLGTATAAQWLAAGVPPGVTPAVGVSFIAIQTATIGGAAAVEVPAASSIDHTETIGDSNLSLGPTPVGGSPNVGGYVLLQCLLAGTVTAPADGTVLSVCLYLNQSSVKVAGE